MLGVKEYMDETSSDKRFEITGVANPQKMRKEFFDTLNSNKVNRNILTDADVEIIQYQGYDLLCIHVPQADYRQRPIYINGNIMNGSFKRNYEGDYHCTEDDVKAMIRDANDSGNDSVLMEIIRWMILMRLLLLPIEIVFVQQIQTMCGMIILIGNFS